MAEKKTTGKTAPKKKPTPKAAQSPTGAKKAPKKATAKPKAAKKAKTPGWLHPSPVDYAVGTSDYRYLVEAHNKLKGTAYNTWRVQPSVFYTIHQAMVNHYKELNG
jgi:hypothetical protein